MATKYYGTCTGTTGPRYDLWLEVTQNSQNIANNTSNVTVILKLKRNDGYSASAYNLYPNENTASLTVGGTSRFNGYITLDTRNGATATLASWTGNVQHSSDGTLSLSMSGSFTIDGADLRGGSVSASFKCTDIPRTSSFTLSKTTVAPGENCGVSISAHSSSFSHIVRWSIGTLSSNTSAAAGVSSVNISVSDSWLGSLTGSNSYTVSVTVETYKGSSLIGKASKTFTLSIPPSDTYKPSFAVSVSDVASKPSGISAYVKGISRLRVETTGVSYKYGATAKSVSVSVGSQKKTSLPAEFSLNTAGNVTVSVTLKDSRGLSRTVTQTVNVSDYAPPSISVTSLRRCDEYGTLDNSGSCAILEFDVSYSSLGGGNTVATTIKYKREGSSAPYDTTHTPDSPFIFGGLFLPASSYEIVVYVTDRFVNVSPSVVRILPSAYIPFNIRPGGKGAAFGGYATLDNELTVGYNLRVQGSLVADQAPVFTAADANITAVDVRTKYYACLGMVFFYGTVTVNERVEANISRLIGSFSSSHPSMMTAFTVAGPSTSTTHFLGHISKYGNMAVRPDAAITAGTTLYMSGFWFV